MDTEYLRQLREQGEPQSNPWNQTDRIAALEAEKTAPCHQCGRNIPGVAVVQRNGNRWHMDCWLSHLAGPHQKEAE